MGDTGVLVAVALARRFEVVGVATRPALVSGQELGARVAEPDRWRRNYLLTFDRFRRLDGVEIVHGAARSVDLAARTVRVQPAGDERSAEVTTLPYDALVIATGVTNGFWRHDRVQDLEAVEAELAAAHQRLARAGTVAVVGGGATGVSAAASLGRRGAGRVHLFHGGDEPLPGYHPKVRRRVLAELRAAGVQVHPHHRAVLPAGDGATELTSGPVTWSTGQPPFDADVVLWATGRVRPHTGFLPSEVLDAHGFVRVDAHLQVPGHREVFAVGDVAASDPARSSARNWGSLVVVRNVSAALTGRPRRQRRFRAPEHRWGSVLGVQRDGMIVFQPSGRSAKVPRRLVQPLLFDLWLRTVLYRGIRRG
jgi:NADH dehydrogenase FAD-containing subunit